MRNLSFIEWVVFRENQQVVELDVARFLEDILEKAASLKKNDMQAGQSRMFIDYVRSVWPPNAVSGKNLLLPQFSPEIGGQRVEFKIMQDHSKADTIHQNGKFDGFAINIQPFNTAQTPEEIDKYLLALKATMHHESEHIFNPGQEFDPNDYDNDEDRKRGTFSYMNNPGELRGHARQMAYTYAQKFPGQPFDLAKAQSILGSPEFNQTHKNYFQSLADQNKWQTYSQSLGLNHANPHDQIMQLVPQYLSQYQK